MGSDQTRYARRQLGLKKRMPKWMPKILEATRGNENARVLERNQ